MQQVFLIRPVDTSHPSIKNRSGYEVIKGETSDISIFKLYWFEPIWFYNPQSYFSKDKMEPGFFLDLADNTCDTFSYVVSPVKDVSDIHLYRRPVTLVRSVARSRKIDSTDEPTCYKISDGFKVSSRHEEELYWTEEVELTHRHSSFTTDLSCLNDEKKRLPTPLPNLKHNLGIDNNVIDNPMSLSNILF